MLRWIAQFTDSSGIKARAPIAVPLNLYLCVWIAMAFFAPLGLAIGILASFGDEQRGVSIALQATARLAFLFFWPAYVGGALTFLFGDLFLPIRRHARELGLAFAAALLVHLGLVVRLCAIGSPPSRETFFPSSVQSPISFACVSSSLRRTKFAFREK